MFFKPTKKCAENALVNIIIVNIAIFLYILMKFSWKKVIFYYFTRAQYIVFCKITSYKKNRHSMCNELKIRKIVKYYSKRIVILCIMNWKLEKFKKNRDWKFIIKKLKKWDIVELINFFIWLDKNTFCVIEMASYL